MNTTQRNQYGTLVAITDSNGRAHNVYCSQQAEASTCEQVYAEGADEENPWGIALEDLIAIWLSDGTVSCVCADSYLPVDAE